MTITPDAFRYFLVYDRENLLKQYHNLTIYSDPIQYHNLLPFHSNGFLKKDIDYREYFYPQNIVIKHFSTYIKQKDKYENDQNLFNLIPNNDPIPVNFRKNFTLIYAITACNPTPHLLREIQALFHQDATFVIFYDNKSNRTELFNLFSTVLNNPKFENVYFVDLPRFHVGWGQITQALTQLVMASASIKYFPDSLYLSFHSESDYPLVPNDYIINILKENYPNNYMEIIPPEREGNKRERKKDFLFFFNDKDNNRIIQMIRYLFPKKAIPDAKWRSGANWFTLTFDTIKKMMIRLNERFELIDNLDYCLFADEIIFVTLATEVNITDRKDYLRYISWRGVGKLPATFTEQRYDELVVPRCNFWSRKFNIEKSTKVLDMLDEHIKNFPIKNLFKYC